MDGTMGRREHAHKICLRHCQASGNWVLIVNGKYITSGSEPVFTREFDIPFDFNGKTAAIYANGSSSMYYIHTLVIDAIPIDDITKKVDVKMDEKVPQQIKIARFRTYREMSKVVAVYVIEVTTGSGQSLTIERRYSDFSYLDAAIRSSTEGHMSASVPDLPPKVYNPFVDQTTDEFIGGRLIGLQQYVTMLLGNSKLQYYTDFYVFLGLSPITGDVDDSPSMMFKYP